MTAQTELLTREQVPVDETWDLTTIYENLAAWEIEFQSARSLVESAASHRGHLAASPERLRQALTESLEIQERLERLVVYARLILDENVALSESNGRMDRVTALSIEVGEALAFFDPEVIAIPDEQWASFETASALSPYRHLLSDLRRHAPHTRSIEIEELLVQSTDLARAPREIFSALDNADIEYGMVYDDDGNDVKLTKGRYQVLMESRNRDVRKNAYATLFQAYEAHKNTLASIHASSVRKDLFFARARGHATSRDAALFGNNLPGTVYDALLTATREARPVIDRYQALRRRALGIDDLAMYDMYVQLGAEPERTFTYGEAVDVVARGAGALGESYVNDMVAGLRGRWVDVRETQGKRSGAYSWGAYGRPPVILMNWNGSVDHVFTLAHEAGHAMHSFYADRAQPYHNAQYSIFLAEVASTLNEILLTWQLLRELPQDDVKGRFSILNRLADTISGTLVRQAMFAEFELRTHDIAERGEPLSLEALNAIYGEMLEAYVPGVLNDERTRLGWSRVPHFYGAFYVFQYATGISAAISLARSIRDEGQPATERYLAMLSAGGSDYPLNVLRAAGVDLESPEPVRDALKEFDTIIGDLEALADRGALEQ